MATSPNERASLEIWQVRLLQLCQKAVLTNSIHSRRLLCLQGIGAKETLFVFNNEQFRVAGRIGVGSYGSTFKVIQVENGQDVGVYAARSCLKRVAVTEH